MTRIWVVINLKIQISTKISGNFLVVLKNVFWWNNDFLNDSGTISSIYSVTDSFFEHDEKCNFPVGFGRFVLFKRGFRSAHVKEQLSKRLVIKFEGETLNNLRAALKFLKIRGCCFESVAKLCLNIQKFEFKLSWYTKVSETVFRIKRKRFRRSLMIKIMKVSFWYGHKLIYVNLH